MLADIHYKEQTPIEDFDIDYSKPYRDDTNDIYEKSKAAAEKLEQGLKDFGIKWEG